MSPFDVEREVKDGKGKSEEIERTPSQEGV